MSIKIFGQAEKRVLEQIERCMAHADYGVLCADNHVGYSQPIGAAIAYDNYVTPSGVGYDIACGNKAVMTDLLLEDVNVGGILDEVVRRVSFGIGRKSKERVDHPVLQNIANAEFKPQRKLFGLASEQLGTVGAGNHFVDFFSDEDGHLWVGVHFGSRGFGHRTASGFLALGAGKKFEDRVVDRGMDVPPVLFKADSQIGSDYILAMRLAGEYAYAGRDIVIDLVLGILGAKTKLEVHNHHNFAWQEEHFGSKYWVVRKGCTPAFPGQRCFVGATMTGTSVILEGIDSQESKEALYTTIHGAGRVMSRTEAAGKVRYRKGRKIQLTKGVVDYERVKERLLKMGIKLRGGAADEAPEVYKNLDEVLQYHLGTVKVLHRLKPMGVVMAGPDICDPYRD